MSLHKFILSIIPFVKFRIEENSMSPTFNPGDLVIILKTKKIKKDNVVVFEKSQDYFVKRVTQIENGKIFVEGDNKKESTDSRKFGWIDIKDIVGKVVYKI